MMRRTRLLWPTVAFLTALFLLPGCTGDSDQATHAEPERPVTEYEAQGRVIRILDNTRLIQIAHGDIEGFMSAMTMPFEFRADSIREAISEGDSIAFRIASDGIDNWITQVEVIR